MKILAPCQAWHAETAAIRRDIHRHPELGYEEHRTSDLVAKQLTKWGVEVHYGLAGTGVVGVIHGRGSSNCAIGLRADMDALPMQEINTFAHASTVPGKMHACGHDGHTAMLLLAARYLAQERDFNGKVIVIFQPAEEDGAGAKRMIDDGLFRRFPVQAVFGMHNWPGLPVGTFGINAGPIMASSNEFRIFLKGCGTHAGMPHLGVDPVMGAVHLAQALQTIVSRNCNPLDTVVLSLTQIHSGSADNVIPESAEMRGTVRAFTEPVLNLIENRMENLTKHIAQSMGCTAKFEFHRNCPATVNDSTVAESSTQVLYSIVGKERVITNVAPSMGAEDFAFMLHACPGSYVWLGAGDGTHRNAGHGTGPCMLHNGSYDFNDDLLPLGATYLVGLAHRWLPLEKT